MKLSILDQVPISKGDSAHEALMKTTKLAQLAEKFGYTRYWIAEHHDLPGLACPAPDIMLAYIGAHTREIRIGAGAVLLPHYKPFNIAERYNLLATLFPDRIDLGIGRAPGGSAEVTQALSNNFLENVRHMPESLQELQHFLHNDFPKDHLFSHISPTPIPEKQPQLWLLGTSGKSAEQASKLGLPYAFGHFMSDQKGPEIVQRYKEKMERSQGKGKAKSLITVTVFCAETMQEANDIANSSCLWQILKENGEHIADLPSVAEAKNYNYTAADLEKMQAMKQKMIIGDPQHVKDKLEQLQKTYEADELMIVTNIHNFADKCRSFELIAKEIC